MATGTLLAISAGVGAAGSLYQGIEQKKEADKQARELQEEANFQANQSRERAERTVQRQKLSYIKSGIQLDSESSKFMFKDTREKGGREASRISERGRKQSSNLKRQGRQALIGGIFGATSSGLQGFGQYQQRK